MNQEKKNRRIKEIEDEINNLERTGESVGFTARASQKLNSLYGELEKLKNE